MDDVQKSQLKQLGTNLKGCFKVIIYIILGLLALVMIGLCIPEEEWDEENTSTEELVIADPYIKGFDPYSTNLALKKYGFKTDRDFSLDGKLWTAERDDIFIKYSVMMYSPDDHEQISSYTLTITVEPGYENITKGKWMMKELSGIKYDDNDPVKVYEWVEKNYNNDQSSIDIGSVRFTILAPSDFVRMLKANKINPETGDIFY